MEKSILEKPCTHHKNSIFSFYCFDDKEFLCNKCFKSHKKHNIEIIDDLKEKSLFIRSLYKTGQSLIDFYSKVKNILESVKQDIEDSLSILDKKLEELKQSAPPGGEGQNVFSLNFSDYEKISIITEILKKTQELSYKLSDLTKEIKSQHLYSNFRVINRSVKILEHSKEYPGHPLTLMLGKNNNSNNNLDYSLFDGINNHFIVLDLGEFFFVKNIKISVDNFDCSLKNFKVEIKNEIGKWEDAGNFVCAQYNINPNLQEFGINKEAQYIKINFIDNWGTQSGNFILVKILCFEVGDIL